MPHLADAGRLDVAVRRLLRDLIDEIGDDGLFDAAAGVAFWLLLSLPAALLTALSAVSLLGDDLTADLRQSALDFIERTFADQADTHLSRQFVASVGQSQVVDIIQASPEQDLDVAVQRAGSEVRLSIRPDRVERDGRVIGFIGASPAPVQFPEDRLTVISYPIYSAWIPAAEKTWEVTLFTLESIKKMIMGAISPKNLSGPITIAQVANATAESGLESFIGFIALLSISLGVINLLPIPVLDGGHLLYYFIEVIAGRPVPERVQAWGLQAGMFIIFSIMILAFYNDLTRL